ncbi:GNAT family N-acetyltransferase [Methylobacterium radiodurans]|uniref:N-acetyltransferase n=1 Tax=Methylobacterium radiodurans TaxID=2202828 RepID=A0A2U8VMU8_9HYPH|nr:GNAT family N-acetyltransferase [Methylobacterium radiodurans]AWN34712.1 N-acetyltransferase [Methylobacterium radiodurans]
MLAFRNAAGVARELWSERRFAEMARRGAGLLYATRVTIGLRRDLDAPSPAPAAKIPIEVRPLHDADLPHLFPEDRGGLNRKERLELGTRRFHLRSGIPTCWVALDRRTGIPCYMQWLMGASHNRLIQQTFPPRWFPELAPDEALLENAYTPAAYRGQGIMSCAMALIAERAAGIGARSVITFVENANVASLRGCAKAGFAPYLARVERRALLDTVRLRRFEPFEAARHAHA